MKACRINACKRILFVLAAALLIIVTAVGAQDNSCVYATDGWDWTWDEIVKRAYSGYDRMWIINTDVNAEEDSKPIVVPEGRHVRIKLSNSRLNRNLTEPKADGYVIRVEGKLELEKTDWSAERSYVTGGNNLGKGGGIYVANGGVLILDAPVYGNRADYGGGIYVEKGGTVYLHYDARVSKNTAKYNGGGIYIEKGGAVYQQSAGGMWIYKNNKEDPADEYQPQCLVSENKLEEVDHAGGGVYCEGLYEMSGDCAIDSNEGGLGAGIAVVSGGEFRMNGGRITNNTTMDDKGDPGYGGGVFVSSSTITMTDGEIEYNETDGYGGGICFQNSDAAGIFKGGHIWNNYSAILGGGVYSRNQQIDVSGEITITGNTSGSHGPDDSADNLNLGFDQTVNVAGWLSVDTRIGVRLPDDAIGGAVLTTGLLGNGSPENFAYDSKAYRIITDYHEEIKGEAVMADAGLTVHKVTFDAPGALNDLYEPNENWKDMFLPSQIVPEGWYAVDPLASHNGYYARAYFSDLDDVKVFDFNEPVTEDLTLTPWVEATNEFTVNYVSGVDEITLDPKKVSWTDWNLYPPEDEYNSLNDDELRELFDEYGVEYQGLYTDRGLTVPYNEDMTYKELVGGDPSVREITLYCKCPHIHKVDDTEILFEPWTSLNSLPTEKGSYYLANDVRLSQGWRTPAGETNLCLNGHSITYTGKDASVITVSGSRLNIFDGSKNSGKITGGNNPDYVGGGISVVTGRVAMYGGTITGNTAGDGGGVNIGSNGVFEMYGGNITGNTAAQGGTGGGVNAASGQFKIGSKDGSVIIISDNKAGSLNSNVALQNEDIFNTITIDGSVAEKSSIGITYNTFPDKNEKRQITSGLGNNNTDIFYSDDFDKESDYDISFVNGKTDKGATELYAVQGDPRGSNGDNMTNPAKISSKKTIKTINVKYSKLRKKSQKLAVSKLINVTGAESKLTYKKVSVNKRSSRFKVNKKTGTLTIKKGTKKGLYIVKIKVRAAGKSGSFKPLTKTVKVRIRVK